MNRRLTIVVLASCLWGAYSLYATIGGFPTEYRLKQLWVGFSFFQIDRLARFWDKPVHIEQLSEHIHARQARYLEFKRQIEHQLPHLTPAEIPERIKFVAEYAGLSPIQINGLIQPPADLVNLQGAQIIAVLKGLGFFLLPIFLLYAAALSIDKFRYGRKQFRTIDSEAYVVESENLYRNPTYPETAIYRSNTTAIVKRDLSVETTIFIFGVIVLLCLLLQPPMSAFVSAGAKIQLFARALGQAIGIYIVAVVIASTYILFDRSTPFRRNLSLFALLAWCISAPLVADNQSPLVHYLGKILQTLLQ